MPSARATHSGGCWRSGTPRTAAERSPDRSSSGHCARTAPSRSRSTAAATRSTSDGSSGCSAEAEGRARDPRRRLPVAGVRAPRVVLRGPSRRPLLGRRSHGRRPRGAPLHVPPPPAPQPGMADHTRREGPVRAQTAGRRRGDRAAVQDGMEMGVGSAAPTRPRGMARGVMTTGTGATHRPGGMAPSVRNAGRGSAFVPGGRAANDVVTESGQVHRRGTPTRSGRAQDGIGISGRSGARP